MAEKLNIKEFLDKDEQKDLLRFLTAVLLTMVNLPLSGAYYLTAKKYMKTSSTLLNEIVNEWEMPESI